LDRPIASSAAVEIAHGCRVNYAPGIGPTSRPPLWFSDFLVLTTAFWPNCCSKGWKPCAIGYDRRSGCAFQQDLMQDEGQRRLHILLSRHGLRRERFGLICDRSVRPPFRRRSVIPAMPRPGHNSGKREIPKKLLSACPGNGPFRSS
jgi:hypothetical protein